MLSSSTNNSDNFLQEMIGGASKSPMDMLKLFIIFMFILYVPVYSPTLKSNFVFLFNNNPARIIWTFLVFWALCNCFKSSLILTVIVVVLLCLISQQDCNILNYDNNDNMYNTYQADSEYCPVNDQESVNNVPNTSSSPSPVPATHSSQNNGNANSPSNGVSGFNTNSNTANYSTWNSSQ